MLSAPALLTSLASRTALAAIILSIVLSSIMGALRSKKWKAQGKHVFITGGSQGLGLAVAELLASKGANVTICSRTESKLREAVGKVKAAAKTEDQKVEYVAADVSTFEGAKRAIESCSVVPDTVFCCAGGAKPGFFIEQTESDFEKGMRTDYWTCLATSHAAANAMARNNVTNGKIVLISSTLGLIGLIGYSQYGPMKHAIRGLAESLRSELILYGISVQAYFPGTILSPGLEEENKTKPKITLEIEGEEEGLTPAQCAKGLIKGVEKGHFFITTDFNTELFRTAALGAGPTNRGLLDRVIALIGWIAIPFWRNLIADRAIRKHRQQHKEEVLSARLR
ncbi:oxidoreductase [Pseudozyma hubeiensis SY62]|uniref:3-dehydrosphinganine reductase n=1 Tax=Pseudozyma hubeiensis (strain SY62) TaxID=1305764 RepID=R9P3B5_PSEHS|nr:oxidoreductase [Pseudozyma hubeiensis SY62]GAC95821.1 oxidoreductase [Pseudozyma hubeiensis SY62]